ncbi:MAG: nitrite reductase (NADH) small subunit [Glaciecola sp.]|jgi:nitrite reductase (NADH) small subunit
MTTRFNKPNTAVSNAMNDGFSAVQKICSISDLIENGGVCALINSVQVALFQLKDPAGNIKVFALSNWDPIGKANVMYRGLIGSIGDEPVICSPLYKQHYSLLTGKCFENEDARLDVFTCQLQDDAVFVSVSALKTDAA